MSWQCESALRQMTQHCFRSTWQHRRKPYLRCQPLAAQQTNDKGCVVYVAACVAALVDINVGGSQAAFDVTSRCEQVEGVFGTSSWLENAYSRAFECFLNIDQWSRSDWPGFDVRSGFTSTFVRAIYYKSLCAAVTICATVVDDSFDFLHFDPCGLEK